MYNNNIYAMNELDFGFNVSSMDVQNPDDNSGINISDVIEVIETDAAFSSMITRRPSSDGVANGAYVQIIEQPAPKALRFRYECEGRSAGSLPGINTTPDNKTFPTIQIVGYKGRAVVVVSCVTKDPPYRPHPHNLVGKENCNKGVCTVKINGDNMTATFANLGIQCVKKKDIEEALKLREEIRVDPFKTGFSHKTQTGSIDLNSVRLCFQAFLEENQRVGKFTIPLKPVVSEPIYDKKAMNDLVICKLSHCSASVAGGQEMILLCEKVAKEDISVRFFEEKDGQTVWEGYADFTPTQVHKQTAIAFRTPRYKILDIDEPFQVYIQLRRPSDGETSEALPFKMTPLDPDPHMLKRKRHKHSSENELRKMSDMDTMRGILKPEAILPVKLEPVTSPNPHQLMMVGNSLRTPLSPHHYSRTPSPLEYAQVQAAQSQVVQGQAGTALPYVFQQGATYIASSSTAGGHVYSNYTTPTPVQTVQPPLKPETTNILDMDTQQQYSLELSFGSRELQELHLLEGTLPNNFSSLVLGDQPNNNTDSLTRIANAAYNDLC